MMLIEETAIADAALPVDQFKAHLRLGTGFAEDNVQDEVLKGFLRAAIAAIEARTGKVLIERGFLLEPERVARSTRVKCCRWHLSRSRLIR